jgi:branched-subunit amino acid transport protein
MSALVVFAVAALVSFGLRASMVLAGGTRLAGAWTERLPLVAPVMLGAIVASSLTVDRGQATAPSLASLAAVGAAAVGVRRTGSLSAALAIGFPVFWVISAVGLG